MTDQPTNQLTAVELNTDTNFEVWQNLAPFGGRPIGGTVEALLIKVVNRRLSVLPIVIFFVAVAVSVLV
jgi:hypothetical protein